MPHKVLQGLWIHSRSRHVATVGMPTNMRSDVRHLHFENVIISFDRMIESVFPMHGYFRHSVLIPEKESTITCHHNLWKVCWSIFNDGFEHLINILGHWKFSRSGICLGRLDYIFAPRSSLKLMIDINNPVLHIDVLKGQSTKL